MVYTQSAPTAVDKTKFKNASGTYIIKPIFFEFDDARHEYTVYTLKEQDLEYQGRIFPSLRRLFIEAEDPTEYSFAVAHLDSWAHWKKLSSAPFFKPYLKEWREELEIRLRSSALLRMKARAVGTSKDAMQADKILLSGGWKTEEEKSVGRPSKEKIKEEAERMFSERSEFDEDFDRILGTVQ